MAKKKGKGKRTNYIAYLFFIWTLFVIKTLPVRFARKLCITLGRIAYKLDKKHRGIAIKNLKMAFPEKSEPEIMDIAAGVFENLGEALFDYARIATLNKEAYRHYVKYEGEEYIKDAMNKKKGVLLISAHLCCWEMIAVNYFLANDKYVIAKDLHNRYVNDYVKKIRANKGWAAMPTRDSIMKVIKVLKSGGIVLAMIDQHTHEHEAEFVDFFGRKASTGYFAALLALKLDICIVPTFLHRTEDGRYIVSYHKPLEIIRTGNRKQDIYDNTQAFTKVIEDEIRKKPQDWLWVHNRWRE